MNYFVTVLIFAVSIVMVIFGAQNTQTVALNFLTYKSGEVSLSLVIVLATVGGVILTGLITVASGLRRSMRERNARKRMEREIRDLSQKVSLLERDNTKMREALQLQARASTTAQSVTSSQKSPIK
jgi:uncharacterized integral membrane protein